MLLVNQKSIYPADQSLVWPSLRLLQEQHRGSQMYLHGLNDATLSHNQHPTLCALTYETLTLRASAHPQSDTPYIPVSAAEQAYCQTGSLATPLAY